VRKRFCKRFTKRLEVTFSSGGSKYTGISSDLSAGGLFIRTQNGLAPGNIIDIEVYLPEEKICYLKGIVRRTVKTPVSLVKNGMGVELIERDSNYVDFLRNFGLHSDAEDTTEPPPTKERSYEERVSGPWADGMSGTMPEFILIPCDKCKVKNKVRKDSLSFGPRCGRCGTALPSKDIG
jgi:hypothetical protein